MKRASFQAWCAAIYQANHAFAASHSNQNCAVIVGLPLDQCLQQASSVNNKHIRVYLSWTLAAKGYQSLLASFKSCSIITAQLRASRTAWRVFSSRCKQDFICFSEKKQTQMSKQTSIQNIYSHSLLLEFTQKCSKNFCDHLRQWKHHAL